MIATLRKQLTHLNPFRARPPRWPDFEESLPWYDQPDALARLERMATEQDLNADTVAPSSP